VQLTLKSFDGEWIRARWRDDEGSAGEALVKFAEDKGLMRIAAVQVAQPTVEKLRRVPLSRIELAANVSGGFPAVGTEEADKRLRRPRYRLKRPTGKQLDDSFYANVARAYRDAAWRGLNPRKTLVEDTGAADATVAGWVMKARDLEYLPKTKRGRVSV
jgi:hypothetical protein